MVGPIEFGVVRADAGRSSRRSADPVQRQTGRHPQVGPLRRREAVLFRPDGGSATGYLVALAKKHASHVLRERGLKRPGPLWAKRSKLVPVESARHFEWLSTQYIPRHAAEGAVVLPPVELG